MSTCELRIDLDRPDPVYSPGEPIRGRVEVRAEADCRCRRLTLTREWRTHGRGNRAAGGRLELGLFEGAWRPGEVAVYPFELDAPSGPFTYHGHYLNVDWYLRARADVPSAPDPVAEV